MIAGQLRFGVGAVNPLEGGACVEERVVDDDDDDEVRAVCWL